MSFYIPDPNDTNKQIPVTNNRVLVKEAKIPAENVVTTRPDHIMVNSTGSFKFLYSTTCSLGGTSTTEAYISGTRAQFTAPGDFTPYKLDINPVAWSRTDRASGTVGDITFVFKPKYIQNAGPK